MQAFRAPVQEVREAVVLPFAPIHLPHKNLKEQNWNSYRVYKNAKEFVTVEGEAAYDAIAKSGVEHPVKVVRTMKELSDVLSTRFFQEQMEGVAAEKGVVTVPKSGIIDPPKPE